VNGAYNILVKAAPDAYPQGRHGCVVQPNESCPGVIKR
jgi:hypothetical protein